MTPFFKSEVIGWTEIGVAFILFALSCHAQQTLLLNGQSTVPLPAASGQAITNTTSGLVNWWKFDENTGTTAADSVGSANGSFASGANSPAWTTAQINSGIISGVSTWINLSANTAFSGNPFSVSVWVFPTNSSASGSMLYDSDNDNAAGFWI